MKAGAWLLRVASHPPLGPMSMHGFSAVRYGEW